MTAPPNNLIYFLTIAVATLASIGLFFFVVTRVSLVLQTHKITRSDPDTDHIYWIYKNPLIIRLVDRMFVVSAILLFQYNKLVSTVVKRLNPSLKDKRILQISCAFGNVSERIAESCASQGAREFVVTDIMQSEVDNAERKLKRFGKLCTFMKQDATKLSFEDQSFDYVVVFFLPHELPFEKKEKLIEEANRVLKPGGKVIFGEFHKPRLKLLQLLGRLYFWVFEPYATEMWDDFDFEKVLNEKTGNPYTINKDTFLFDNFQVLTAKRMA